MKPAKRGMIDLDALQRQKFLNTQKMITEGK